MKLPVLSTLTVVRGWPPMVTVADTLPPLNPVPATVTAEPTAPFFVAGLVTTTFAVTVKVGGVTLVIVCPSLKTSISCVPAVVTGTFTVKLMFPPAGTVTVAGDVLNGTPSNLALRIWPTVKFVATIDTEPPTGPVGAAIE
jgi:hypothetical protein